MIAGWGCAANGQSVQVLDLAGKVWRHTSRDFGERQEVCSVDGRLAGRRNIACFAVDAPLMVVATFKVVEGKPNAVVQVWNLERGSLVGGMPVPSGSALLPVAFREHGKKLLLDRAWWARSSPRTAAASP